MDEINIQVLDMDVMIPEQIIKNADGSYTIFLNARLTHKHRLKSYEHAIRHIKAGDFEKPCGNVQEIETMAHSDYSEKTQPNIIYTPSKEFEERRAKVLSRIRKERRKIQKQLKEYEEDIRSLENAGLINLFAGAEHYKLYGNDL